MPFVSPVALSTWKKRTKTRPLDRSVTDDGKTSPRYLVFIRARPMGEANVSSVGSSRSGSTPTGSQHPSQSLGCLFLVTKLPSIQSRRQPACLRVSNAARMPPKMLRRWRVRPKRSQSSDQEPPWTPGGSRPDAVNSGITYTTIWLYIDDVNEYEYVVELNSCTVVPVSSRARGALRAIVSGAWYR